MKHINGARLLELSVANKQDNPFSLDAWEEEHLLECADCQDMLQAFLGPDETALDDIQALRNIGLYRQQPENPGYAEKLRKSTEGLRTAIRNCRGRRTG